MGLTDENFVVVFNCGAERSRVLEALEPVARGFKDGNHPRIVFVSSFHPKDPDAPYAPTDAKGVFARRPSVYDAVLDELQGGQARMIREPDFRSLPFTATEADGKRINVKAFDFVADGKGLHHRESE